MLFSILDFNTKNWKYQFANNETDVVRPRLGRSNSIEPLNTNILFGNARSRIVNNQNNELNNLSNVNIEIFIRLRQKNQRLGKFSWENEFITIKRNISWFWMLHNENKFHTTF